MTTKRYTARDVAKLTGHRVCSILRGFIREGLLPYPRQSDQTWAEDDVLTLKRWLDSRKRGARAVRPDHRTW